ncbi:MAG: glycerol-3-phosphate acyltransferase [Firmicutes bacterium]|nr:glycerol-3-phosphate acyltransferase [Bacillota bacterium]
MDILELMVRILFCFGAASVCYLIGNINFAIIISKLKKRDVRKEDSGNPGAMNMLRNFGTLYGGLTLLLDALKGAFAAVLGWFVLGGFSFTEATRGIQPALGQLGMYVGGAAVIIGHVFPVFFKFKGGKGIASSIGVCFVLNPWVMLITLGVGVIFILLTKMGSVTSFIIIGFPLAFKCLDVAKGMAFVPPHMLDIAWASIGLMILIFLLTLWAHRKNLKKLFLGVERKTSIFSRYKSVEGAKKKGAAKER